MVQYSGLSCWGSALWIVWLWHWSLISVTDLSVFSVSTLQTFGFFCITKKLLSLNSISVQIWPRAQFLCQSSFNQDYLGSWRFGELVVVFLTACACFGDTAWCSDGVCQFLPKLPWAGWKDAVTPLNCVPVTPVVTWLLVCLLQLTQPQAGATKRQNSSGKGSSGTPSCYFLPIVSYAEVA